MTEKEKDIYYDYILQEASKKLKSISNRQVCFVIYLNKIIESIN
jgi:hypothetical protein